LFKDGFGSNKSHWNGPPFMNKWITRFAFGAKWGAGFPEAELAKRLASAKVPIPAPVA
jgi:hypothetical protein